MPKLFSVVILALLLVTCQRATKEERQADDRNHFLENYQIIVIDKCQYIFYDGLNRTAIAHKGNCSNKQHTKPYKPKRDKWHD